MKLRNKKKALLAVAVVALAAFQAGGARADDTAAEIRLLKARLNQLEEKVAKQDRKQKETKAQVRHAVGAPPAMVCKGAPCPPPPPPVWVSFKNGLKVEALDHDFNFKIGGRIFVDGGVSSQPVHAFAGKLPFFPAHAASGFSNQVGFRQARLEVEGMAFKDWEYRFQVDFTGAHNGLVVGGIRDAYLAWRYFEPFTFQVGNFFEPNSLERSVSAAKYRDFIERSLAGDLLAGNRHIGLAVLTGGAAPGILGDPNWSAKAGIFSTSLEDGAPVGATTTAGVVTNAGIPAGSSSFLNPVSGGHQYWDAAGRLTYAPVLTEDSLLHFGGSVRYQQPNDATAASDDRVLQPGGTLRSSANILGENLLGTQPLTCVAATAQLVGQNCTKDVLGYGAELAGAYGPFSVQAEYLGMHYNRNAAIIQLLRAPGASTVDFSGYYVYATWYLTGESRAQAYLTYPKEFNNPAGFGQIKILHPVSSGGYGAWEVAARFDEINLNSGGFLVLQPVGTPSNIQGGRQTDFTLGLNWYPDRGMRFMANWVKVLQLAAPFNRPDINGIHPNFFEIRAQVDW